MAYCYRRRTLAATGGGMKETVFNTMCTPALAYMRFMSSQASDWLIPDSRIKASIGGNRSERNGSKRQWFLI